MFFDSKMEIQLNLTRQSHRNYFISWKSAFFSGAHDGVYVIKWYWTALGIVVGFCQTYDYMRTMWQGYEIEKGEVKSKDCWQNSFGFLGSWSALINSYIHVRSCHIIILLQLLGSWRQQAGKHNVITGSRDYNEGCRCPLTHRWRCTTTTTIFGNNNNNDNKNSGSISWKDSTQANICSNESNKT